MSLERLLKERKLNGRRTAEEINRVVREFNAMLGKYLDDDILEKWEVSFNKGSLSVGSALDKWGIDIDTLKQRTGGSKAPADLVNAFIEILEEIEGIYREEKRKDLMNIYPVARVVLDSVVRTIPNPIRAQKYRIPSFWEGNVESKEGRALIARC